MDLSQFWQVRYQLDLTHTPFRSQDLVFVDQLLHIELVNVLLLDLLSNSLSPLLHEQFHCEFQMAFLLCRLLPSRVANPSIEGCGREDSSLHVPVSGHLRQEEKARLRWLSITIQLPIRQLQKRSDAACADPKHLGGFRMSDQVGSQRMTDQLYQGVAQSMPSNRKIGRATVLILLFSLAFGPTYRIDLQ